VPLPVVVLLDLVAERRPRADAAHLAADDVPELRQLVERELPQQPPAARDARVPVVHREAGAHRLGPDDHRAQLEELEVGAVAADAGLPVEDRPAVLQLDREGREGEERRREEQRAAGQGDVRGAVHASSSRCGAQVAGTPRRR
jgi:hypothetical protein